MFTKYINNPVTFTTPYFAAIIGSQPSKGARSPTLWNNAFKKLNMPATYLAFDTSEDNIKNLVATLRKDKKFIGGSVTNPYKEKIFELVDEVHPSAQCGAVNCLYRSSPNKIGGMNTDGLGAYFSLKQQKDYEKLIKHKNLLSALLWGSGGVAKAIACALLSERGSPFNKLTIVFRNKSKLASWLHLRENTQYKDKLNFISQEEIFHDKEKHDVIFHCTPVGSQIVGLEKWSACGALPQELTKPSSLSLKKNMTTSLETLKRLSFSSSILFDVNYTPSTSVIMSQWQSIRASTPLNGLNMNLLQAVVAFSQVMNKIRWLNTKEVSQEEILKLMSSH